MRLKQITEPSSKTLGEIKLVGYRVLCAKEKYADEIQRASNMLANRLNEMKHIKNSAIQYGAFIVDAKTKQEDGYWVMVEVEAIENIPEELDTLVIPPQKYAAAKYKGTNKGIFEAYEELHNWAAKEGYKRLTEKWHLEIFEEWKDPDNLVVELLDTIE